MRVFVVCLAIGVCLLLCVDGESNSIHCRRCKKSIKVCKARLKKQRCFYRNDPKIPAAETADATAPAPEELKVTYDVVKISNKSRLVINVSWIQMASFDVVKGYFFRVQADNTVVTGLSIYFDNSTFPFDVSKYPKFDFTYHNANEITPGEDYYCNMMSLPLFHKRSDIKEAEFDLTIPGCSDNNEGISSLSYCKYSKKMREKEVIRYLKRKDKLAAKREQREQLKKKAMSEEEPVPIVVYVVPGVAAFCLLLILVVVAVYILGRRKRSRSNAKHIVQAERRKLLIVVNNTDELGTYLDASNIVASMLGKNHAFNLWNYSKWEQPYEWTEKQLQECEHVVFICTPQGKVALECLPDTNPAFYYNAFALTYNKVVKNNRYMVTNLHFNEARDCVPEKLLQRGKSFRLAENVKEFLQHVSGKDAAQYATEIGQLKDKVDEIRHKPPHFERNNVVSCQTSPHIVTDDIHVKSSSVDAQDSGISVEDENYVPSAK